MLQKHNYLEDGTIAIDNQAAVKALNSFKSAPGQQLINYFLNQMQQLKDRVQGVPFEVYWVPGHKGVTSNEEADKLAKRRH
jgi:ribonuclease HI